MTQRFARVSKTRSSLFAIALLGSGLAMPAMAQDADEDEDAAEEQDDSAIGAITNRVVITATKGADAEDVQDVPLAVTAFNSDTLDALKVRDVESLTYSAPNVSLDQIGTARGTANFSMRGLGINSSIPSIDPTVGVFVDGVYLGFNGGVVFDLFDLESVELVRGPQGVLFGRNVTGGAVLLNTGNPTDTFQGKFRAAIDGPLFEDRGGANYTISGVVSGPLVPDLLNFKLGAYFNNDDGYFTNLFDGSNHGRAETTILRGALEFTPTDTFTILAKADWFESNGDGPAAQNHGIFRRDTFDFSIDNRGGYDNEIITTSVRADLEIGPGTLTNIFGWRTYDATTDGDIDSSPLFLFHSNTETAQEQISNELRYAMEFDALNLTIGGFYFDQSLEYTEVRDLPTVIAATFYGGGQQDHEVVGIFAQGEFFITDRLSLIAGLRWSEETKDADVTYVRPRPACTFIGDTASECPQMNTNPFVPGEPNGFSDSNSWSNWTPKVGFQYEFDDAQIYAHWTRGFRSGGYNFRITNPAVFLGTVVPATGGQFYFDEEEVNSYEIGGKYQTPDGVLTLNLAAYMTDINNMQREVNQSSPTAGVSQFILNTADASIYGFEGEARARVTDNLVFTANIGIIEDTYDAILFDISGDGVIDQADFDLRLPRVPKVTWGFGFIHELLLGSGSIVSRANVQYRDEFAYTDNNFGYIPEVYNVDANITWNTPVEGLAFSIYAKNIFDEVTHGGDTQLPFPGPLGNGVNRPFDFFPAAGTFSPLSKGRVVGAEVTFEFGR